MATPPSFHARCPFLNLMLAYLIIFTITGTPMALIALSGRKYDRLVKRRVKHRKCLESIERLEIEMGLNLEDKHEQGEL